MSHLREKTVEHLLEVLVADFGCKPRTFAEIQFELRKAKHEGDQLRMAYALCFLSLFHRVTGAFELARIRAVEAMRLLDRLPQIVDKKKEVILEIVRKSQTETERTAPKLELAGDAEKVLECLRTGSKDKFELIRYLYGEEINFFVAENRFKNLMHRIRQKCPDLIRFERGSYCLLTPKE